MECENCGHTTFIPGQMGDMIQTSGECPNCGVPYRHQPGGDNVMGDEMAARGMPAPGEQDMGGNPLQEGIWGSIDGGWKNRMKRDESYASLRKKADDDDFDWDDDDGSVDLNSLGQGGPQLHSRFIVTPEGQVHTSEGMGDPSRVFHEDIARANGLPLDETGTNPLPGHSTGEAWSDGDIDFVTHETPFDVQQMGQILQPHYPQHNMPMTLPEHTTFEDRMGLTPAQQEQPEPERDPSELPANPAGKGTGNYPDVGDNPAMQQQKQKSIDAEKQRGRAFPYYDNPFFNRGGGHNPTREQTYDSWQYEMPEFEIEQVIEPGPHTEEVDVEGQNPIILQHDDQGVLDEAKLSLESHKLAFLPLLLGLGAGALAGEAGAGMIGRGLVSGLVRGAMGQGKGGVAGPPPEYAQPEQPAPFISSIHEALSQSEHPSSIPKLNELEPDEVDPHEHEDGDHSAPIDDFDVNGGGGTDDPHSIPLDGEVGGALEAALPALLHFYHSDEAGADDPTIQKLIEVLEREHPGTLDADPSIDDLSALDSLKTSKLSTGILPVTPMPGTPAGQTQPQMPAPGTQQLQNPVAQPTQQVNPVSQANCPQCGARVSPGQGTCPQCGSGLAVGQTPETAAAGGAVSPQGQPPVMGSPFTAGVTDYGAHDEILQRILARPDLSEQERNALNVAMAMRQNNMSLQNARDRAHRPIDFANAQNPPAMMPDQPAAFKQSANGGPTNPEQFQMVIDAVAQSQGVTPDQLPAGQLYDIIQNPGNYADVLAQIQGQGDRPQPDPDPGVPPPMPDPSQMGMDPAAMGGGAPPPGMPMQARTAWAPTRPSQGNSPCPHCKGQGCDNCGGTGEVPNGGLGTETGQVGWYQHPLNSPEFEQGFIQDNAQQRRFQQPGWRDPRMGASDSITPPCPKCGSHTTGMITDEGRAQCSNCNNTWDTDFEVQGDKTPVATKAAADDSMTTMPNPVGTPAADQTAPDDLSQDVNPNIWQDQQQQPLQVGQEYEMYSSRYDVPDVIRVTAIKPDSLEYVLTGEYGLEHRTAVSRQEAEMDGLTFLPTDQSEPEDMQPQEALQQPQPAENPMASPMLSSWNQRLAGKKFTPMEQREFINESGQARNSDKLDLAGTHYENDESSYDDYVLFW